MKLHIGAGSIYLDSWVNVDVPAPRTFLAHERPDLVDRWKTTDADYYGRHREVTLEGLAAGPLDQEYVCDRYGSFGFLPVREGKVSEILTRQSFEHLSAHEAREALRLMRSVLKPMGVLRIDVPDHLETLRRFRETGDDFYIRHLLGPKRNEYGTHMQSYTLKGLCELVEGAGFRFQVEERNIHLYPAFCVRFER